MRVDWLPIINTLRGYTLPVFRADLCAGLNVALLAFPQGITYAVVAGLPVQYGLYGSGVASVLGALFSKSRVMILGPTNAPSVLLISSFAALGISEAAQMSLMPLLLLMVGVFLLVGAYMRLADLTQYLSQSVLTGYVTAAAALIIANQVKYWLGLDFAEQGSTLFDMCRLTCTHFTEVHWPSVLLGLLSLALYILLQRYYPQLPNVAITLVILTLIAHSLRQLDIPMGEEHFIKPVSTEGTLLTLPQLDFDAIRRLADTALAVALLCLLEGISVGRSMAARTGMRLNPNQEMRVLGIANIGCGLLSGMPASGSLTRSNLNLQSGAATPLASLYNGVICLVGTCTLSGLIGYIPKAALATLVMAIGLSLVNWHSIRIVTRATRSDGIVFFSTLISGSLLPLTTAIFLGVGLSIALFLRKARMPEMIEYQFNDEGQLTELTESTQRADPQISIVHLEGALFFGAAELFREQMRRICEEPNLKVIILKMRNAHHLDATSILALEELISYIKEHDRILLVSEARKDVINIFKKSGLLEQLSRKNVFADISTNPTASTAKALKRAETFLRGEKAQVRIYVKDTQAQSGPTR